MSVSILLPSHLVAPHFRQGQQCMVTLTPATLEARQRDLGTGKTGRDCPLRMALPPGVCPEAGLPSCPHSASLACSAPRWPQTPHAQYSHWSSLGTELPSEAPLMQLLQIRLWVKAGPLSPLPRQDSRSDACLESLPKLPCFSPSSSSAVCVRLIRSALELEPGAHHPHPSGCRVMLTTPLPINFGPPVCDPHLSCPCNTRL